MRKTPKLLTAVLIGLLFVTGCKRETFNGTTPANSPEQVSGKGTAAKGGFYWHATEQEIQAAKTAWLNSISQQDPGRGGCGSHISEFIFRTEVTASNCPSSSWNVKYVIFSKDNVGNGYELAPVTATFTNNFSFPISATLESSSEQLEDPLCDHWMYDDYCVMIRRYDYALTNIPASAPWPASIGTYSLGLRSGFANTCTPLTVAGNLTGGFTITDYQNDPAHLNVDPLGPGSIYVTTECTLICPPPYVICPNGGTIQYWPQGSPGSPTTQSIPYNGAIFTGLTPGIPYDYTATLNYTIGGTSFTSPPKTGTFTP